MTKYKFDYLVSLLLSWKNVQQPEYKMTDIQGKMVDEIITILINKFMTKK